MKKKYVVTQVWVRQFEVEADDDSKAYDQGQPDVRVVKELRALFGLNFSNWHVFEVKK